MSKRRPGTFYDEPKNYNEVYSASKLYFDTFLNSIISENLKTLILVYNRRYGRNLTMTLSNYKENEAYKILNQDNYSIIILNKRYQIINSNINESEDDSINSTTDNDNVDKELYKFVEIIYNFIKCIINYIDDGNKNINKVMRYIIIYQKYGELISLLPNKSINEMIKLNVLPYINYFRPLSYFNFVREINNRYLFNEKTEKISESVNKIDANVLYDLLDKIVYKEDVTYNNEISVEPINIPGREETLVRTEKISMSSSDIIKYAISFIGAERCFAYLLEAIKSDDFIINNIMKIEIEKLKALMGVYIKMPKILNIAMNNIHLAYIIDLLPKERLKYFYFIFKSYDKLGDQAPSVYIFLQLLNIDANMDYDLDTALESAYPDEFNYINIFNKAFKTIDPPNSNAINYVNDIKNTDETINFDRVNNYLEKSDKFNKIDYEICKSIIGNNLRHHEPVLKLLDFIKYNRGCTRIFYEVHAINDLKLVKNAFDEEDLNQLFIIPVLGSYCFHFKIGDGTDEGTAIRKYENMIPIRYCNLIQIENEIHELREKLGTLFEIVVNLYIDDTVNSNRTERFKYQHLNYLADAVPKDNTTKMISTQANGIRKIVIPIVKLSRHFLTEVSYDYKDIFEEYKALNKDKILDHSFIANYDNIKRIEIRIKKSDKYISTGGYYLPLKIKDNETNLYLEEVINKMQLISIKSKFNAPLCCFVWAIINTPNINKLLTDTDIERIKIDYGKSYIATKEIKNLVNEYNLTIEIKRFGYINGEEKIEPKIITIKPEIESNRKLRIGFIKYGSFTHYFPIFTTEITKFCCKNLDLSVEEYYDIDATGEAKIENYKIIEGIPRRNKNENNKSYAESDMLLDSLIEQNKLEWISNFDNELFNYNKGELNPNLKLIEKYGDIMSEEIIYPVRDNSEFSYICAADTETYTEENKLVPFCICCNIKRDNKYYKKSFYGDNCQNEFLQYLCDNNIKRVYFHNLKFDGWLFKNFMIRDMIYHSSKLYSLTIYYQRNNKKNMIELYDSLALIPSALKNFPKMFNLDKMEKELYPYNLINKERIERGYLDQEEVKAYFKEDYEEFMNQYIKNIKNNNDNKIDIKKLTIYYCQNDVDLLLNGLIRFEKMGMQLFDNISPLRFLTISSYSYNIMIKNCFNKLSKYKGDIKNYIRRSIRGGRCMVRNNEKIKAEGEIVDFDACSLYPSAMHRLLLPTGDCYCSSDSVEVKRLFEENIMKENQLEADNNKYISYMILHVKIINIKKTRNFPLLSYQTKGINLYTNEMIGKEVYLTSIELEDFLNYQDGKVEYIDAIYWKGNKDNRMSQYIANCYDLRREYKKQGNPLQEVLKLFMNSSYGKTIQKDIKEEYKFVSPEKAESYLKNNYGRIKEIIELNPSTSWIKIEGSSKPLAVPCHIGALILGMSKRIMNEVICLAEDNDIPIYYQDTDSIHMNKKDVEMLERLFNNKYQRKLIGSEMGQFHIDFPLVKGKEPISKKSIFLGKKAYIDCLFNEDGDKQYFIRMKGVPEDVIINTCNDMNISVEELYERMYEGSEVDFNLLNSDKPKFDFTKDFQIMVREKFSRKIKF